ncbi:MAG: asparagine synthase C-terminal domain-containing protein [Verrucomicrobia bacterium]|nr:asparagine synthase C-terminal domain-containing protein [Verrucomicrobiota bacterium]MBU1909482.1 asparagine synthase C-terminal domain-containing protein [Verrucomicrobiota bacterium]
MKQRQNISAGVSPIRDIRAEIKLKAVPTGQTEVTGLSSLNAQKTIGREDILNSRGEFAGYFCEPGRVVLFRDRLGARSLFYILRGDMVLISSDLGWIAGKAKAQANWNYIRSDYLQFQIPFSDETFFEGVKRVMPGEFVCIEGTEVRRKVYWKPRFGNVPFEPEVLAGLIREAVAFRLGLIGDRPFTSYLSGGIDSSTASLLAKPSVCFSGFYEEEGYSETDYIETVVQKGAFPGRYVPVHITKESFQRELARLPEILPEPCAGLGVIPQVLVAQEAARQGFRFAFTGEGGDEIFLGYNWNTVIFSLAQAVKGLLRDRYMIRYEPMVEKILRDAFPTFTGGLLARGDDILYATKKILALWEPEEPVENNILKINLQVGLPAILMVDEQVGRSAGVEPVSPLMDHKIVEYVCSIRPQDRAPIPKFMLREAMKGVLPEKVRMRYDKMGFPVPYQQWEWDTIQPNLRSLANRKKIEVDPAKHTTMDRQTWALVSLELWYQHYFERKGKE